jgi:hypothetical protein
MGYAFYLRFTNSITMEALDYLGLFGAIALIVVCIWWLNDMYKSGRENAGKEDMVVFFLPDNEKIKLMKGDHKGMRRIKMTFPKSKYQLMKNNQYYFYIPRRIKWLESDIQKGVI